MIFSVTVFLLIRQATVRANNRLINSDTQWMHGVCWWVFLLSHSELRVAFRASCPARPTFLPYTHMQHKHPPTTHINNCKHLMTRWQPWSYLLEDTRPKAFKFSLFWWGGGWGEGLWGGVVLATNQCSDRREMEEFLTTQQTHIYRVCRRRFYE